MSGKQMETTGGAHRSPSVADETEYARSRMVLRVSRPPLPQSVPYQVLPWEDKAEKAGKALSPRELELLCIVRDGASNKQAAFALGVSEQTIKNHMISVMGKLGVSDRTAAVIRAVEQGIIALTPETNPRTSTSVQATLGALADIERRLASLLTLLAQVRSEVGLALHELADEQFEPVEVEAAEPSVVMPDRTAVTVTDVCKVTGCEAPVASKRAGPGRRPTKCERHVVRRIAA